MDVVFPQGNKMKDLLYDEDDDTDPNLSAACWILNLVR